MDKSEAVRIVQRYLRIVSGKYQIENAIIFGSYAKGNQHHDSDIDLAIIFKSFGIADAKHRYPALCYISIFEYHDSYIRTLFLFTLSMKYGLESDRSVITSMSRSKSSLNLYCSWK